MGNDASIESRSTAANSMISSDGSDYNDNNKSVQYAIRLANLVRNQGEFQNQSRDNNLQGMSSQKHNQLILQEVKNFREELNQNMKLMFAQLRQDNRENSKLMLEELKQTYREETKLMLKELTKSNRENSQLMVEELKEAIRLEPSKKVKEVIPSALLQRVKIMEKFLMQNRNRLQIMLVAIKMDCERFYQLDDPYEHFCFYLFLEFGGFQGFKDIGKCASMLLSPIYVQAPKYSWKKRFITASLKSLEQNQNQIKYIAQKYKEFKLLKKGTVFGFCLEACLNSYQAYLNQGIVFQPDITRGVRRMIVCLLTKGLKKSQHFLCGLFLAKVYCFGKSNNYYQLETSLVQRNFITQQQCQELKLRVEENIQYILLQKK